MAINYKAFPLGAYPELIAIWEQAREAIESGDQEALYLPIGKTKSEARELAFLLHRVRAAMRAQKDDGHQYDFLVLRIREFGDDDWGIKLEDRGLKVANLKLTLHNKSGEPI